MSRNHSIEVIIRTKTKEDTGPASTITQESQFVVTNPSVTDERIHEIMALVTSYLDPSYPLPEVIDTETPS